MLCTVDEIKEFLDITKSSSHDDLIDRLINVGTTFIENYCGRVFEETEYLAEYHDGGIRNLFVKNPPISSEADFNVWSDPDRDFTSDDLIPSTDYGIYYNAGIAEFEYKLLTGKRSVKVQYTGGFSIIPADITQVVIELVGRKYKEGIKAQSGVQTRTLPDGSAVYSLQSLLPWAKDVLDYYTIKG